MSFEDKVLFVDSIEDILRCINLASLLELSGYPKPGNVHRNKDFIATRFEHFLAGIAAIQPNFQELCKRIFQDPSIHDDMYANIQLGLFFNDAAEQMMKWQKGGNVLLGHILIMAPLLAAATICIKKKEDSFKFYSETIKRIILDSTIEDTIYLYHAIRRCNPGGLGEVKKFDLNDDNSLKELKKDNMNLKKIFDYSRDRDLISHEYSSGYDIILNEGLPYYFEVFKQTNNINVATVNTFLKILAEHPDSLIIRKAGLEEAREVSRKAREIINHGGITSKKGRKRSIHLDSILQHQGGRLNPGTTADLIAGIIFCALLFGLRF